MPTYIYEYTCFWTQMFVFTYAFLVDVDDVDAIYML
jgi:hypothetical protein